MWKDISKATKDTDTWILGYNGHEQRVIRWCTEYPLSEGCWMFAYSPSDYIDGIQQFKPTHYMDLPKPPVK